MEYGELPPVDRNAALLALAEADPYELATVVLSIGLHEPDPAWAGPFCLDLTNHANPEVRGNAVLSLGHLVRRFGRDLPGAHTTVMDTIEAARIDPSEHVRRQAEAAGDDARHYLRTPREL